jgi:hypothetical protein
VVELEDGEQEVDGEGRGGLQLFVEGEEDLGVLIVAAGAEFGDFGAMEEAVGDDVEDLAGLGAQDAGEMGCLFACEGGVGGMAGLRRPCVGDEAAAHKGGCWLLVAARTEAKTNAKAKTKAKVKLETKTTINAKEN